MPDIKSGVPLDKITNYIGHEMKIDLKNHHQIVGILSFFHLTEQMIHIMEWADYDADGQLFRQGKYMVINRTAWFQLYC